MYSRVIVQPPVEPLTLTEVKLHVAVDHDLHDDMLTAMIREAREYCEEFCQRSLITQTRETALDAFADALTLPYGPVQAVSAVSYVAGDGVLTDLDVSAYEADLYAPIARVMPAYGTVWPSTLGATFNGVRVTYVAGYAPEAGSPTDYRANVPGPIKRAMFLLIGNAYENREASVTGLTNIPLALGVDAMLTRYRLRMSMA